MQKVREEIKSKPKSIESIEQLIDQQQQAVDLLHEQRANVLSMIQQGKELAKDTEQTPEYLSDLVTNLESEWNDAYSKTVENLNNLKGTEIFCVYDFVYVFRNHLAR